MIGEPARDVRWRWRVLLAIHLGAMIVAMHWPRLRLDGGVVPASDKLLHFGAFLVLAALLHLAGAARGRGSVLLVGVALAVGLELTQGIPGLGRTVSGWDVAANVAGVLAVAAWEIALRPLGGPVAVERWVRLRRDREALARDGRLWAGAIGGLALVTVAVVVAIRSGGAAVAREVVLAGAIAWALTVGGVVVAALVRAARGLPAELRPSRATRRSLRPYGIAAVLIVVAAWPAAAAWESRLLDETLLADAAMPATMPRVLVLLVASIVLAGLTERARARIVAADDVHVHAAPDARSGPREP